MLKLKRFTQALLLTASSSVIWAQASSLVVNTTSGVFQGVSVANGTERWLGIPFAQPPVGELRFKAPVPITSPLEGLRIATDFGSACPQAPANLGAPISEDCLYINIWRPTGTASSEKLPVLAWIYVSYL